MKKSQLLLSAGLALLVLLTGCERPPTDTVQHGYRGTGNHRLPIERKAEA